MVQEAGAQGGDSEGSAARQKSSNGEGNALLHGKYFEASDVHIFFLFLQFANVCVHSLDLSNLMVYKARS